MNDTPQPTSIKIQKALAELGVCSRRAAEVLIQDGKVLVNGQLAVIGQRVTSEDILTVEGKEVSTSKEPVEYWLVYKPVGTVSTTSDELGRPTVLSLLPATAKGKRLYPVGRLDIDSQGLMLLTNDGNLTHLLTHPSKKVTKTYRVKIMGHPTDKALEHLESGVKLKEGFTAPAGVSMVEHDQKTSTLDISIHEGRNRQVRRMLRRVGYEDIISLERRVLGPFTIEELNGATAKKLPPERIAELIASMEPQKLSRS